MTQKFELDEKRPQPRRSVRVVWLSPEAYAALQRRAGRSGRMAWQEASRIIREALTASGDLRDPEPEPEHAT